ncbi:hypothetical protein PENSPDRAFT_685821 [Peniophora sp. CONT]|nr:hypothetical protein PENSPDRAFT_685821 [Peniophora sp. CONT]
MRLQGGFEIDEDFPVPSSIDETVWSNLPEGRALGGSSGFAPGDWEIHRKKSALVPYGTHGEDKQGSTIPIPDRFLYLRIDRGLRLLSLWLWDVWN